MPYLSACFKIVEPNLLTLSWVCLFVVITITFPCCHVLFLGYDLKQLFIGSEGSLGVITAASISVPRRPKVMCFQWLFDWEKNNGTSTLTVYNFALKKKCAWKHISYSSSIHNKSCKDYFNVYCFTLVLHLLTATHHKDITLWQNVSSQHCNDYLR